MSLLLFALITGVFWGTWFTLTRTIEIFTPETFLAVGKTIIGNVGIPMRIIMPTAMISVAVLLWLREDKKSLSWYCVATALFLLIITTVITVGIEVPIDFQIRDWTVKNIPADWTEIRSKWQFYLMLRTFICIAGLAAFIWGTVNLPSGSDLPIGIAKDN